MRRIVPLVIALAALCAGREASAAPKFPFSFRLSPKPAVAAPALAKPGGRTLVVAPGGGLRRTDPAETAKDAAAGAPSLAVPAVVSAPAVAPAPTRSASKDSPDAFRARCDAAQGAIVGAVTHGFCVFN